MRHPEPRLRILANSLELTERRIFHAFTGRLLLQQSSLRQGGMTISCRVREDMNFVGYQVNSAGFAGRRGPFFIFT